MAPFVTTGLATAGDPLFNAGWANPARNNPAKTNPERAALKPHAGVSYRDSFKRAGAGGG